MRNPYDRQALFSNLIRNRRAQAIRNTLAWLAVATIGSLLLVWSFVIATR